MKLLAAFLLLPALAFAQGFPADEFGATSGIRLTSLVPANAVLRPLGLIPPSPVGGATVDEAAQLAVSPASAWRNTIAGVCGPRFGWASIILAAKGPTTVAGDSRPYMLIGAQFQCYGLQGTEPEQSKAPPEPAIKT